MPVKGKNGLIVSGHDAWLLDFQCSDTNNGYARVYLDKRVQLVHRVIYEQKYNVAPDGSVRHLDGDRKNCTRENIAFETGQDLNLADDNWKKDHKLGRCVYEKNGGYAVYICKNYKLMYFGTYDNLEDARNVSDHVRELARTMPRKIDPSEIRDMLINSITHPSYANRRR